MYRDGDTGAVTSVAWKTLQERSQRMFRARSTSSDGLRRLYQDEIGRKKVESLNGRRLFIFDAPLLWPG